MAKQYLIEVVAHAPAPRRFQYRMDGTNMGVAVGKAMRQIRKDLPRKRIYLMTVKATVIGNTSQNETSTE